MTAPSPILSEDDAVMANVLRLAGLTADTTTTPATLSGCEGMTIEDALAACHMNRSEAFDAMVYVQDTVIRSDQDGWAEDAVLYWSTLGAEDDLIALGDDSQPVMGLWVLADETEARSFGDIAYATGFVYDMYAAAATLLDMFASRLKLSFTFGDGTGNYARREKYDMVVDAARRLRAQAKPRAVSLTRADTGAGTSGADLWERFESETG